MILAIFIEWLQRSDKELVKTNKFICLVLDNCTAHYNVCIYNENLEFFPPNNTTSLIHHIGVIQNLMLSIKWFQEKYIQKNISRKKSLA